MSVLVHVGVRATNLEESVRFWRDGLGLRVIRRKGTSCDLSDGYHNFKIFQHEGESRPEHVGGMLDYLHVGVGVTEVSAAARRLREMGYEIFSDGLAGKRPVGPDTLEDRAFKVEDPDGITVDVSEIDERWPGISLAPGDS